MGWLVVRCKWWSRTRRTSWCCCFTYFTGETYGVTYGYSGCRRLCGYVSNSTCSTWCQFSLCWSSWNLSCRRSSRWDQRVLLGRQLRLGCLEGLPVVAISWTQSWWEEGHLGDDKGKSWVRGGDPGTSDSMGWAVSWTRHYFLEELYGRLLQWVLPGVWRDLWPELAWWLRWKLLERSRLLGWAWLGSMGWSTTLSTWTSSTRWWCWWSSTTRCNEGWGWCREHPCSSSENLGRSSTSNCPASQRPWIWTSASSQRWQVLHLWWKSFFTRLPWQIPSLVPEGEREGEISSCIHGGLGDCWALLHEG